MIDVRGLCKTFRIYRRPADRLWEALGAECRHTRVEALRAMDLEVMPGETVGIVGRNGSGKSTLLQLIAGTLQPSSGRVVVRGRIAALLELGSGFNPDFSGRENVFLNGQVLGLRRREIEQRFERILEFADIGDFIDQPVRTYSSGMLVRLAFAAAINTDPEVLIIDEALAVGDEAFQRKCFARIEQLKAAGSTILFVSHSVASVMQLCDRAVLLDSGRHLLTASAKDVVTLYQAILNASPEMRDSLIEEALAVQCAKQIGSSGEVSTGEYSATVLDQSVQPWPLGRSERFDSELVSESAFEYLSRGVRLSAPELVNEQGTRVNVLLPDGTYRLRYRAKATEDVAEVEFNMAIRSTTGVMLYGASSHGRRGFLPVLRAGSEVEVEFSFHAKFLPGTYFLNVGCQGVGKESDERIFLHRVVDASCFRVDSISTDRYKDGFYDLSREPAATWREVSSAPAIRDLS